MAAAGKIKIVGIIASLAALALVLSPTFSLLQSPGADTTGADRFPEDADFMEDDTVVEDVSEDDLIACSAVNESVQEILGVVNGTVDNRKVASDKLVAEFCSRPVLIHEITSTDYASLSLVAYACDASSGKIGTAAMKDSLSDHNEIYCDSARKLIVDESEAFLETIEEFRTEYLPVIEASQEDEDVESFNVTNAKITLDRVTELLEESLALVDSGEYYPAATSFDRASKMFLALFKDQEASL